MSREVCPTFLRPALQFQKGRHWYKFRESHEGNKLIPHFKVPEVEEDLKMGHLLMS